MSECSYLGELILYKGSINILARIVDYVWIFCVFQLMVGQNKTSPVPLWAPGGYRGHFPLFSDVTQNKPSQQIMNIIVKCSYNLSCLWKPRGFWLTVDPRLVPAVHERLPLYPRRPRHSSHQQDPAPWRLTWLLGWLHQLPLWAFWLDLDFL